MFERLICHRFIVPFDSSILLFSCLQFVPFVDHLETQSIIGSRRHIRHHNYKAYCIRKPRLSQNDRNLPSKPTELVSNHHKDKTTDFQEQRHRATLQLWHPIFGSQHSQKAPLVPDLALLDSALRQDISPIYAMPESTMVMDIESVKFASWTATSKQ